MPTKIRSRSDLTRLSPRQSQVLEQTATGKTADAGAESLGIATGTYRAHMRTIGRVLQCTSTPAKVHAGLTSGQIKPPPSAAGAPPFTPAELLLLKAIAEHCDQSAIAHAAKIHPADVHPQVKSLMDKSGALNRAHLVGLGHTWHLLGNTDMDTDISGTATTTGDESS